MPGIYKRKDHLYKRAKAEGYRSRAAFKLHELNNKYKILRPGLTVVDLGCFPGGWLQVAMQEVSPGGRVIGIDLVQVQGFSPAEVSVLGIKQAPTIICGDIRDRAAREEILQNAGQLVDVVLSDMSPKLSGISFKDSSASAELVNVALESCSELLRQKGTLVAKIFPGPESDEMARVCRERFARFHRVGLKASRNTSKEFYFVCLGYHKQ